MILLSKMFELRFRSPITSQIVNLHTLPISSVHTYVLFSHVPLNELHTILEDNEAFLHILLEKLPAD